MFKLYCYLNNLFKVLGRTSFILYSLEKIHKKEVFRCINRIPVNNKNKNITPPIIARMISRTKRDLFTKNKTLVITNKNIAGYNIGDKVTVTENLTSVNRNFQRLAKIRGLEVGYRYVWFKYGKLLVRKNDGSNVIRIYNEEDVINKMI